MRSWGGPVRGKRLKMDTLAGKADERHEDGQISPAAKTHQGAVGAGIRASLPSQMVTSAFSTPSPEIRVSPNPSSW